jgi:hypothetical protein
VPNYATGGVTFLYTEIEEVIWSVSCTFAIRIVYFQDKCGSNWPLPTLGLDSKYYHRNFGWFESLQKKVYVGYLICRIESYTNHFLWNTFDGIF